MELASLWHYWRNHDDAVPHFKVWLCADTAVTTERVIEPKVPKNFASQSQYLLYIRLHLKNVLTMFDHIKLYAVCGWIVRQSDVDRSSGSQQHSNADRSSGSQHWRGGQRKGWRFRYGHSTLQLSVPKSSTQDAWPRSCVFCTNGPLVFAFR